MLRDFLFNLDNILKMLLKSKKKLTFLTTEKRNKLKQRIITEKQAYAQEFKEHFCNCYLLFPGHHSYLRCIIRKVAVPTRSDKTLAEETKHGHSRRK